MERRTSLVLCLMLAASLSAPVLMAATDTCAPADRHPVISWNGSAATRVYFRAAGMPVEHYVDLSTAADGVQWAVLPKPAPDAEAVEIRIVRGSEQLDGLRSLAVTTDCAAPAMTTDQARATGRIVVGAGTGATSMPAGFRCDGVVAFIDSSGVLRTDTTCGETSATVARGLMNPAGGPGLTKDTTTAPAAVSAAQVTGEGVVTSEIQGRPNRPRPPRRPRPPISRSHP